MLNLVDDEPQVLANGHVTGATPGPTTNGIPDPVAELMGLSLGGQSAGVIPNGGQTTANGICLMTSSEDQSQHRGLNRDPPSLNPQIL